MLHVVEAAARLSWKGWKGSKQKGSHSLWLSPTGSRQSHLLKKSQKPEVIVLHGGRPSCARLGVPSLTNNVNFRVAFGGQTS